MFADRGSIQPLRRGAGCVLDAPLDSGVKTRGTIRQASIGSAWLPSAEPSVITQESVLRILHTMLRVGDLDRSIAFYTSVLGMGLVARHDFPAGRFTLAFVGYASQPGVSPSSAGTPLIELTHNWDTPRYDLGSGFGHIAIEVQDAHATCEAIKTRGGKVVREAGPMQHGSTIIAFAEDPDGYRIELIQQQR